MTNLSEKQIKNFNKFKKGIKQFESILLDLKDSDYDYSRGKEKWTIREIIHHIADAENLWKICIKAAIGNPGCDFDLNWYLIDNKWAKPLGYYKRNVDSSIDLFKVSRNQIIELVDFYPEAYSNFITIKREDIPEGKKFTVEDIINFQILHLNRHIKQISDSRKRNNI